MDLCAAVDTSAAGAALDAFSPDVVVSSDLEALTRAGVEVAVDFTTPASAGANAAWCLDQGIHVVVGTTGLTSEAFDELRDLSGRGPANALVCSNFAVGAVLMMRFAEIAAPWMPDAEIIELHHPGKLDSPSGTSISTAEAILRGRSRSTEGAGTGEASGTVQGASETLSGARGADLGGVHLHSVRLPGLVAHQEVIFGGPGQTLSMRHDTTDRTAFMPGVLLGIREVPNRPGLTIGLESLLGL